MSDNEKISGDVALEFLALIRAEAEKAARTLPPSKPGTFADAHGFRFYAAQRLDPQGEEYVQWELLRNDGTDSGLHFDRWAP